jgi:AraC-like DNA-binding protein
MTAITVLEKYLESKGIEPVELISDTVLLAEAKHLGRYPMESFCQILIAAARRLDDPYLGLHLGQTVQPSYLGALGYVLLACGSLGEVLLNMQRYHRLIHDLNPVEPLFDEQGNLVLQWGVTRGKPGALFDELGIASCMKFGRDLCQGQLDPLAIDFVNPGPPDVTPYISFFRCPVRFNQPFTRIVLPLTALQMPLRQSDPLLLELLAPQVEAALSQLPDAANLIETTRRIIANIAPDGVPELEQVAHELYLSPQVLYKRLADQGVNFRNLREDVLHQLAESHLMDESLPLSEVSALLGYTEQSAFSRAFKRWTGLTPAQWRASHTASRDGAAKA